MKQLVIMMVLAVTAVPAFGQASAVTTVVSVPVEEVAWAAACTNDSYPPEGEVLELSGRVRFVSHVTTLADGGTRVVFSGADQGVVGVGTESGLRYHLGGGFHSVVRTTAGLPFTTTAVGIWHLIGEGGATNMNYHSLVHITINAEGVMSAWMDRVSLVCRS